VSSKEVEIGIAVMKKIGARERAYMEVSAGPLHYDENQWEERNA
jgi:hypothetical protein